MKRNKNLPLGATMILISTIFYGSYGIWTRLMGDSFGPFMQNWIRCLLVCVVMTPFVLRTKEGWQPIRWRRDRRWLGYAVLSSLLIGGPLYYSINKVGIGLATLIMYVGYLSSMFILGKLFNDEKFTADKIIATAIALVGLVLVFIPSIQSNHALLWPSLAALLAGLGVGLDLAVSKNITYNSAQSTIIAWGGGVFLNAPIAFILHENLPSMSQPKPWLYLGIFVLVGVASSWSSIHGVKLVEAGAAGILGLLEIVWALFFGILLFHEHPRPIVYLGALCIIAAAAIPYFRYSQDAVMVEEVPI